MAKRRFSNIFVLILSITLLAGCATRIGTQANIDAVVFTVGKTTKKEVADILGLPALVGKDKASGAELWGYQKTAALVLVQGAEINLQRLPKLEAQTFTIQSASRNIQEFQQADAIYMFNSQGVLVDAKNNQKEK